jgi:hypothetical protein
VRLPQELYFDCLPVQEENASLAKQSAADHAAFAGARKEITALKRQNAELQSKLARSQFSRSKGKTFADVYRGDTMKRDGTVEDAAAKAVAAIEHPDSDGQLEALKV